MRRLRLLTILLTLFSLPGYGLAGIQARSCQSQLTAGNPVAVAGDCCPGKADPGDACKELGKSGLPGKNALCSQCKAGYNCKSPQSFEPTHMVAQFVNVSRPAVLSFHLSILLSPSPDGLWRPPRLI